MIVATGDAELLHAAVVGFGDMEQESAGAGFLAGSVISDVTSMSCFEGAGGYFAAFIGLAGLVVGAIGGGIVAVWLAHRRRRKPVA